MEQEYDIADQARQKLMSVVPEAFADGKILWEKLRESLGDMLDDDDETAFEHYGLNWPGKRKAKKVAATPSTLTLTPLKGEGIDEDTTENIFIEGDNLEVLKILYKSYKEKIKMIYIDPPYNTGNDFVYNDDFRMTEDELMRAEGSIDEQGNRLVSNKKTSGRFHANWLNMMYPRLKIARELLKDDGVIFISIDDNEVHNLRLLCDEIFGEENFIAQIANTNNPKGRSDDKFIATAHEYIIVYAKTIGSLTLGGFEPDETITKRYNKIDANGKKYREMDLRKTGDSDRREDRPQMYYYFYYEENKGQLRVSKEKQIMDNEIEIKPLKDDNTDGRWRWGFDTAEKNLSSLMAKFMPNRNIWGIFEKDYLDGRDKVKPTSSWTFKDVNSERGSEQFIELGFDKEVFPRPKPIGTIERILKTGLTNYKKEIVLDFFAGSGTFAHAVMNLKAAEGFNCKFICVQLPELISEQKNKEAFNFCTEILNKQPYISEITKERIKRASKKVKDNFSSYTGDIGMKVFKTVRSSHKKWGKYSITTPKEADGLFATHQHSLIDNWEYDSVMTEIILTEGFTLTSKIETFDSVTTNQIVRISDPDKEYVLYVCLDEYINPDTIKALNMNDNDIFICLGSAIDDQNLSALHDKGRIRTL